MIPCLKNFKMKRVDHMIRYLSGELTREEADEFEKELSRDKKLSADYNQVATAYRLIGEELRKRDEESFKNRLREVMGGSLPGKGVSRKRGTDWKRGTVWYLLVPLAASVAFLVILLTVNRSEEKRLYAFFKPSQDPVILAFSQDSRGASAMAISAYKNGHYQASLDATEELLAEDPENQLILLYNLLSSIELDREEEFLARTGPVNWDNSYSLGRSLTWYTSLALIKSGQKERAVTLLESLQEKPGPYGHDAYKLERMLKK